MQTLQLLVAAALVASVTLARADGTTRVAVVDTARLYDTGGITRWLTARAKLDTERTKFVVVESPDGKPLASDRPKECESTSGYDELKKLCKEIDESRRRQQEEEFWAEHERSVLGPIESDVRRALERYARAHGIDLLLDRHELGEMLLVVAAGVDITVAFIKDYNAASRPRPSGK